jgi:uncharacterized DUF497 family protein
VGSAQSGRKSEETRVSFEEAATVFSDENARLTPDPDHSASEDRFILLGPSGTTTGWAEMRKNYDFSQAKKNPYAGRLKKQVTIRLEEGTVAYFKNLADELGIPYQTLINLYLRDCASSGRRLNMAWKPGN